MEHGLASEIWDQIYQAIDARLPGSEFTIGVVTRRNEGKKQVWVQELGNQPIPVAAFETEVKFYDEGASGAVKIKNRKTTVIVPKVGQTVLIVKIHGTRRMSYCIGIVQGVGE